MIVNIDKGIGDAKMAGIVDYHEKKVGEGLATKDYQNFHAPTADDIKEQLISHVETFNSKVYKQRYHHIDINFAPEDEISFEDQQQLIKKYLEGMSYNDHLQVRYHHQDKSHDHWHVLVPCSNLSGERQNISNDFHYSTRLSRQLEKEFGLRELSPAGEQNESLEIINHENYRFFRAIQKLQQLEPGHRLLVHLDNGSDQARTNDQIRYVFTSKGLRNEFRELIAELDGHGLLEVSNKSKVYKAASLARQASKNLAGYLDILNSQGIYARVISTKDQPKIKYGIGENSFYIDDHRLNKELTLDALNHYWYQQKSEPASAQDQSITKSALKATVNKALRQSADISELKSNLQQFKIELIEHSNKGGIYGLSFRYGETTYKASALGFSYSKINDILAQQQGRGLIPLRNVKVRKKTLAEKLSKEVMYQSRSVTGRDAAQADFERQRQQRGEDNNSGGPGIDI